MKIKIGLQLAPQHGDYHKMRDAWMEAEDMGADALFTADHFFAQNIDTEQVSDGQVKSTGDGKNYEAASIQAAMAATTTRAQIGCMVHAIHYRNPHLMADIARTIDHISGGRYILGLGSGYIERDYVEYDYPYGTQKSRLLDLRAALPIIKERLAKLTPQPLGKLPILVASLGDKIGLPIVAEYADMWHVYGPMDKIRRKHETFLQRCEEVGRDPAEIEIIAGCMKQYLPDNDPDILVKEMGINFINCVTTGPDWDLAPLRELIEWRKALEN